uniref:Hexosyltransferase n=1 Tax=Acrobeloides nanus TaxID=290746 RepID=A0A914ENA3_9BILA
MDKTKMIFLLGSTSSPKDDFDVMMEEQKHGDIAKLNILENYRNLTLKTYGLISYADKYCKNVKCVIKMDTDVEVNVEELEDLCRSLPDNEQMITGQLFENAEVFRNISSKWYVPHYVYSNKIYPNFTNGIVREKAGIKIQDYKALHSGSTKFPSFFFGRDDFGTGSFRAHTRRPK